MLKRLAHSKQLLFGFLLVELSFADWPIPQNRPMNWPLAFLTAFIGVTIVLREQVRSVSRKTFISLRPHLSPVTLPLRGTLLDIDWSLLKALLTNSDIVRACGFTLLPFLPAAWWFEILKPASSHWLRLGVVILMFVGNAFAHASSLHWGRRGIQYPFARFPLVQAVSLGVGYLLILWVATSFLFSQLRHGDPVASAFKFVTAYAGGLTIITTVLLVFFHYLTNQHLRRRTIMLLFAYAVTVGLFWGSSSYLLYLFLLKAGLPITTTAAAGAGWFLTIVPTLTVLPILSFAFNSERELVEQADEQRCHDAEQFQIHVIRGQLLAANILQTHLPFFLMSLPLSMLLALQPLSDLMAREPLNDPLLPWTTTPASLVVVNIWLVATLAWLAPVIKDLYFFEDACSRAFAVSLGRCFQRLRDHTLVLGFGDLGRRFVRELFVKQVITYESPHDTLRFSENILMPNGRLGKLLLRVAVIDSDSSPYRGSVVTGRGIAVTVSDVSQLVGDIAARDEKEQTTRPLLADYLLPVVLGDIRDDQVLAFAGFDRTAFAACLARRTSAEDPSLSVVHRLEKLAARGIRVPTVLALHSSAFVPYVTSRAVSRRLPLHFILPEHLEGLHAANTLHAFYRGVVCTGGTPRILIIGRGKRLFYLLDTFLKNLNSEEYKELRDAQFRTPRLTLLGLDDVFAAMAEDPGKQYKSEWWRDARAKGARIVDFNRSVFRKMSSSNSQKDREPPIPVPVFLRDPRDIQVLERLWSCLSPVGVLVSDNDALAELRVLHAVVHVIARTSSPTASASRTERSRKGPKKDQANAKAPQLFVISESGKRYLSRFLGDALLFYEANRKLSHTAAPFPSPSIRRRRRGDDFDGDCLIDVLSDPVERLVGLFRAYHAVLEQNLYERPFELDLCKLDQPGAMASGLLSLSGYSIQTCAYDGEVKKIPTFASTSMVLTGKDQFRIRSLAFLVPVPSDRNLSCREPVRAGVVSGQATPSLNEKDERFLFSQLHSLLFDEVQNNPVVKAQRELLNTLARPPDSPLEDSEHYEIFRQERNAQLDQCCGMPNCHVEGFHKIVEAQAVGVDSKAIENERSRNRSLRDTLDRFMLGRTNDLSSVEPIGHSDDTPYAHIDLHCSAGLQPGTFGLAMAALLLRSAELAERDYQANFTYASNYECHDGRFDVMTCYGYMQKRSVYRCLGFDEVLERIVISPVHGEEAWKIYADLLLRFLNQESPCKYLMDTNTNEGQIVVSKS